MGSNTYSEISIFCKNSERGPESKETCSNAFFKAGRLNAFRAAALQNHNRPEEVRGPGHRKPKCKCILRLFVNAVSFSSLCQNAKEKCQCK